MKKSLVLIAVTFILFSAAFYILSEKAYATTVDSTTVTTFKHEIAYWWGKVNQHKEDGVWMTDPDGVSGANINKYEYCKKWYPSTVYAVYDDMEYINDFKNAGNLSSFAATVPTYECTDIDITADYEAQKKLFKNNEVVEVNVGGITYQVKLIASSGYNDFLACGDTRFRGELNGSYVTRYLCIGESESITIDNERIKVILKKVIHSQDNVYGVAEVVKDEITTTPLPDLVVEDIEFHQEVPENMIASGNNFLSVKVCNQGTGKYERGGSDNLLNTKLTADGVEASQALLWALDELDSGECSDENLFSVSFFPNITKSDYYTIEAEVDATNIYSESNENNNIYSEVLYINLGEGTPPAQEESTLKHKIAYWWGKVNQHTENGEWITDPDGVSGADIGRYTYCKKWYPSTQYAIYDGREYIEGFQNAGNTGWYSETPVTYHCTNVDVTADYATQKQLFKSGQSETVIVAGEAITVKAEASSLRQDFDTCGDTRIRFKINGSYLTRFMCVDEYDSITYDNGRVKINLLNLIHGEDNIYGVAEIFKEDVQTGELTPVNIEEVVIGEPATSVVTETEGTVREHIHELRGTSKAQKLIQRLKGRILLQVESVGEAYYVSPDSNELYYLQDGPTAYNIMEDTGLGISESDFNTLMSDTTTGQSLRQRVKGKILLRVQANGEAYYINPETLNVTYMVDGDAAYDIMREQSLGISNNDLGEMIGLE